MSAQASSERAEARSGARWAPWALLAVSAFVCVIAWASAVKKLEARALAEHPIATEATVTRSYINGFGDDPLFDYRYRVGSRTLTGTGGGERQQGERIVVEYARTAPAESCFCDAAHGRGSPASSITLAALLTLPLLFALRGVVPLARGVRFSFVPVRGVGEWIGFLAGVIALLLVCAVALLYLLGIAFEPQPPSANSPAPSHHQVVAPAPVPE